MGLDPPRRIADRPGVSLQLIHTRSFSLRSTALSCKSLQGAVGKTRILCRIQACEKSGRTAGCAGKTRGFVIAKFEISFIQTGAGVCVFQHQPSPEALECRGSCAACAGPPSAEKSVSGAVSLCAMYPPLCSSSPLMALPFRMDRQVLRNM